MTQLKSLSRHPSNHVSVLTRRIAQAILALLQTSKAVKDRRNETLGASLIPTGLPVHSSTEAVILDVRSFETRFGRSVIGDQFLG